jgi:hypothetical protein
MRRTLSLLAAAVACVLAGGWLLARTLHVGFGHGLYCAVGLGLTNGCDVAPHGGRGQLVATAVMLIVIPLLAAAFARLTAMHAAGIMHRLRGTLLDDLDGVETRLKAHASSEAARHARTVLDHVDARHDALKTVVDTSGVHAKLNALSATLQRMETAQAQSPAPAAPAASGGQQGAAKTPRSGKRA